MGRHEPIPHEPVFCLNGDGCSPIAFVFSETALLQVSAFHYLKAAFSPRWCTPPNWKIMVSRYARKTETQNLKNTDGQLRIWWINVSASHSWLTIHRPVQVWCMFTAHLWNTRSRIYGSACSYRIMLLLIFQKWERTKHIPQDDKYYNSSVFEVYILYYVNLSFYFIYPLLWWNINSYNYLIAELWKIWIEQLSLLTIRFGNVLIL